MSKDSFKTHSKLMVGQQQYDYFSLEKAIEHDMEDIRRLPFTLKILLENLLRKEDGVAVTPEDVKALAEWPKHKTSNREIAFQPARVLMQDFTGVPAVVDLAAMRDAMQKTGGDTQRINPLSPVDLVIDHSVQVDAFGNKMAFAENVQLEMQRNFERYEFLRWGQKAFKNFRVVPPGTGICHQVNLEYLAKTVWNDGSLAYPDTLVGTDSHTTMINGLGVLGWGVGGIEAEAAMLGQPISMLIPEVIGFKLEGKLREGITATDLVLTVTQMLRERGVVDKFVEFYGPGLSELPLPDRATIANMAPEYGATCGFFPVDQVTVDYLRLTGREESTIALVEAYCKAQGLWHSKDAEDPVFTDTLQLNLKDVEACVAGPKRPQDRVVLGEIGAAFKHAAQSVGKESELEKRFATTENFEVGHGDVVIAAITSCTNTSNPSILMCAGLLAKKAIEKGLTVKPWVKTSLAPGSKVVTSYLDKAGLQTYLDQLGFNLVGYGCTTCIGNSGPLSEPITKTIQDNNLVVSAVLSGNRNFEGRIHPNVKANWLASPPLVIAFALAGTTLIDLGNDPLGKDKNGNDVYLKDIWPSNTEVAAEVAKINRDMFRTQYADVFTGDQEWQQIPIEGNNNTFGWKDSSTYVRKPPFFEHLGSQNMEVSDIIGAKFLALLGDSITTDHISPAGNIQAKSAAGLYLQSLGVAPTDFNSYGARRGNHEVMMRGTFANIRIRNEMVPGTEGGFTKYIPTGETMFIYDASMKYQAAKTPLVIVAGKEYGTGSSRDWAAKGTRLLGVKAVIAESFERIHRSNLIGMGVLPLQFESGQSRQTFNLDGSEEISIVGIKDGIKPRMTINAKIKRLDGSEQTMPLRCRIDTQNEVEYYQHGGILQYVLQQMMAN